MSQRHIPYFSFYPADFMNGVRGLTPQEVGVYTMLLCRIYEENGPVEANIMRLSTYCGMREKSFSTVLDKLVALGKFHVVDGCITNRRAEIEIQKRSDGLKSASRAGKVSAKKRQQKQTDEATPVDPAFNHSDSDTDTDKEGGGGSASAPDEDQTILEQVCEAAGSPLGSMTVRGGGLGSQADGAEVARWKTDLGLTDAEILASIREQAAGKHDGPPARLSYFTKGMQRLAGLKARPALTTIEGGHTRSPPPGASLAELSMVALAQLHAEDERKARRQ